jgi:membrane-associated protein
VRIATDPITPAGGRALRLPDALCALAIAFSGIYSLAFLPAIPSLLGSHPVLLESLTGSTAAIVTAGAFARVGRASLVLAILAAVPGTMMFDPLYWWAGRRFGRGAIRLVAGRSPRATRSIHRAERCTRRFGGLAVALGYFLPVPNGLVYAAAGWTGMRLRTFLALDLLGALLWIGLLVGLGYALGASAVHVAQAVSRYALATTVLVVVGMAGRQAWRARSPHGARRTGSRLPANR